MATIASWSGTMTDIGPMYPFVGTEMLMVIVVGAFWVAWHIIQTRAETREFEDSLARLKDEKALREALDREG